MIAPGQRQSLVFGPFVLELPQQTLYREGQVVRLGGRARALLLSLLEAEGELVSREQLIAGAWPKAVVEEGALRVHISALRKLLGQAHDGSNYIHNESGRGYRIATPIQRIQAYEANITPPTLAPDNNLPGQISAVLGRDEVVARLAALLTEKRCLTIAGPGGIGKTTVAVATAHQFMHQSGCGVCFVDLAPLGPSDSLAPALASALNFVIPSADAFREIINELQRRRCMLVLDNCEHLVGKVAIFVERLLQDLPNAMVVLTSREPLRVQGEWVHRLAPLGVPDASVHLTAAQASMFSAVQLFVERACAANEQFVLDDTNAASVCEVCHRLDGMPLAIEFAAARMDWFDVHTIKNHLDSRFKLLTNGRRTALPRHQTLRATLDWSYELLGERPKALLQRISLFRSSFTMTDMMAVASCTVLDSHALFDTAGELIAKSMMTSAAREGEVYYRLLDTTRFYAMELLAGTDDDTRVKRRHATYCRELFVNQTGSWDGNIKLTRLDIRSQRMDDIRAAVAWGLSTNGEAAVAIDLLVASSYLWFHLSIANEFFAFADRSLSLIANTDMARTALHVNLLTCFGQSRWHTYGPEQMMSDAFILAMEIASELQDDSLRMHAVWGLWMHRLITGDYDTSLKYAQTYHDLAVSSLADIKISTARNMLALSLHFLGDPQPALQLMKSVLEEDSIPERSSFTNAAQVDGFLSSQGHQMIMMWVHGELGKALDLARATAEELVVMDHDLTICAVLATGVLPVVIGCGDLVLANSMVALLRERAERRDMQYWAHWGDGYLSVLNGEEFDTRASTLMQLETFASLGHTGALTELQARNHHLNRSWAQPELARLHALTLDTEMAIQATTYALELSTVRSAHLWRLRAALQLAKLQGGTLRPVVRRQLCEALELCKTDHEHPDIQAAWRHLGLPALTK